MFRATRGRLEPTTYSLTVLLIVISKHRQYFGRQGLVNAVPCPQSSATQA